MNRELKPYRDAPCTDSKKFLNADLKGSLSRTFGTGEVLVKES